MQRTRRTLVTSILAATLLVVPASLAGATHTGDDDCHGSHSGLAHAHSTIPHFDHAPGTHQAHQSAPYCPPHDAPRHAVNNGNGHH